MKFYAILPGLALLFTSCATPDPAKLENTIEVQDEKMYEKIEKARLREEKWDRRWEDYSARQDAKYDAWIDSVFD
jgi:hypothetical protein